MKLLLDVMDLYIMQNYAHPEVSQVPCFDFKCTAETLYVIKVYVFPLLMEVVPFPIQLMCACDKNTIINLLYRRYITNTTIFFIFTTFSIGF